MFVNELYQGGIRALLDQDPTLFAHLALPSGISAQQVVDRIIFKYGDTPLFAPDPAVMKYYIPLWSQRRLPLWERYKEVAEAQYNPIENYDRYEEGHNTLENKVSADNVDTYQPDNSSQSDANVHIHGNIGVTTSAQMQAGVFDLIPRFDVVDYIADDFKQEFCLLMYN